MHVLIKTMLFKTRNSRAYRRYLVCAVSVRAASPEPMPCALHHLTEFLLRCAFKYNPKYYCPSATLVTPTILALLSVGTHPNCLTHLRSLLSGK